MSTQKTKPLTDSQIDQLLASVSVEGSYVANLVRAVEIYHGIYEETPDESASEVQTTKAKTRSK